MIGEIRYFNTMLYKIPSDFCTSVSLPRYVNKNGFKTCAG